MRAADCARGLEKGSVEWWGGELETESRGVASTINQHTRKISLDFVGGEDGSSHRHVPIVDRVVPEHELPGRRDALEGL